MRRTIATLAAGALLFAQAAGATVLPQRTYSYAPNNIQFNATARQYAPGNVIGNGYATVSNFAKGVGYGAQINGGSIFSKSTLPVAVNYWICDAPPTGNLVDGSAVQMTDADTANCHRFYISSTLDVTNSTTGAVSMSSYGPAQAVVPVDGNHVYIFVVSLGTFTPANAGDVTGAISGQQD